jgi:hypothetical protein
MHGVFHLGAAATLPNRCTLPNWRESVAKDMAAEQPPPLKAGVGSRPPTPRWPCLREVMPGEPS